MIRCVIALTLLVLTLPAAVAKDTATWVLVDTEQRVAEVRRADETIARVGGIALGRSGTAPFHLAGDRTTPLGEYRITRINRDSRYHIFIGLDYPTLNHLEKARAAGAISADQYSELLHRGWRRGRLPPDSVLGGHIGLHGLGKADPTIHRRLDWTQGCVAMTDSQIERLTRHVTVGTRVVIR